MTNKPSFFDHTFQKLGKTIIFVHDFERFPRFFCPVVYAKIIFFEFLAYYAGPKKLSKNVKNRQNLKGIPFTFNQKTTVFSFFAVPELIFMDFNKKSL